MSRTWRLRHAFVKTMPPRLEEGVLYVSLEHTVMMHLCACGCGNEVALPLSPTDWRLTYDGQSISVRPSIGSWSLPCRSHYFIDGGRVVWAGDWTDAEIAHGRALDRSRRATRNRQPYPPAVAGPAGEHGPLSAGSARAAAPAGHVAALWQWLCRGRSGS